MNKKEIKKKTNDNYKKQAFDKGVAFGIIIGLVFLYILGLLLILGV